MVGFKSEIGQICKAEEMHKFFAVKQGDALNKRYLFDLFILLLFDHLCLFSIPSLNELNKI